MDRLNSVVKALMLDQKDAVFATVSKDGIPNIVPIHSKHIISNGTILISDQFMNKTRKNVLQNPAALLTRYTFTGSTSNPGGYEVYSNRLSHSLANSLTRLIE